MVPSPDHQLALAVIDAALAANEAAVASHTAAIGWHETEAKSLRQARAHLTGEADVATSLHGPAIRPEKFIGAGEASNRYNCCDDTIRKYAREYSVETIIVGKRARFSVRDLDKVLLPKKH